MNEQSELQRRKTVKTRARPHFANPAPAAKDFLAKT